MNNRQLTLGVAAIVALPSFLIAQTTNAPLWEARTGAPRNDIIDSWWCETWHLGDHVETISRYNFEGVLKIDKNSWEEVKWWELAKKFTETELFSAISGTSKVTTDVLAGAPRGGTLPQKTPIQLIRSYESPMSTRGEAVTGLSGGLEMESNMRKAELKVLELLDTPEAKEALARFKDTTKHYVVTAIKTGSKALDEFYPGAGTVARILAEPTADMSIDFISGSAAKAAKKRHAEDLAHLAGGQLSDGGVEAKRKGWFFKKADSAMVKEIKNLATSVNELFDLNRFYIAGEPGNRLFAKMIVGGPEAKLLDLTLEDESALTRLSEEMRRLPASPDDEKARDILAREALDVNAKLFSGRRRSVGDKWQMDASALNGFLHVDLKGTFKGRIFMQYVGDETLSLTLFGGDAGNKVYKVRHLRMVNTEKTNFKYSEEGGFELKYNSESASSSPEDCSLDVYVDKDSGYILSVDGKFKTDDISVNALPDLKLTKGFSHARGKMTLAIRAESLPLPNLGM